MLTGGRSFHIVLLATVIGFCSFYAPQPLLPTFANHFNVSSQAAAWLLTLPFFALALAPIVVGSVLQRASAQQVLATACAVLSVSLFAFSFAPGFNSLLVFRAVQAVMLPILFTAAVTYCSKAGDADTRQTRIAIYITATIMGGFSGRIMGGFLGEQFGWQAPFIVLGTLSLLAAVLVWTLVYDIPLEDKKLDTRDIVELIKRADIRAGLLFVFTTFFTFSGALNVIPFRLVELQPDISSSKISLVYIGYSVGIFIPLVIQKVMARTGGAVPTLRIGLCFLLVGLVGLFIPSADLMLLVFLILSMGMFTIHATAQGLLNEFSPKNPSVVNGAYISNYYSAAAVGSIIPVWLVDHFGWNSYVVMQLILALTALWHLVGLKRAAKRNTV